MTEYIKVSNEDGILTITMSRSDKKNAITSAMYLGLAEAVAAAETDPAVRVVLFRGEGDSFTAGNDIGDLATAASGAMKGGLHFDEFMQALVALSKPAVAAVQGRAVGIGTTMLLHCDFIVLAENAKLSTPFVSLAVAPEASSSALLPARIGYARAFEMFALGDVVDAQTAFAWGLANRVVPLEALDHEALAVARRLSRQPLGSLMATKRLMRDAPMIKARLDLERTVFGERLASAEAREAFSAFRERRPPDFAEVAHS